jgi:hypothetical protein
MKAPECLVSGISIRGSLGQASTLECRRGSCVVDEPSVGRTAKKSREGVGLESRLRSHRRRDGDNGQAGDGKARIAMAALLAL